MENTSTGDGQLTRKRQLYDKILKKIMALGFPRDLFLTEAALAVEFGTSRVSIRETLITLCNDQILKNIPRIGYQIVQLTVHNVFDAMRTRAILEVGAAREYLPKLTDAQLTSLLEKIEPSLNFYKRKDVSIEEWWHSNCEFHTSIARLTGNELLVEMLERTLHILWRANVQYFLNKEPEKYLKINEGSHEEILSALKSRSLEQLVENLMKDNESLKSIFQVF